MPTVCIHCSLKVFVESNGKIELMSAGVFDTTPEEHLALLHPNGVDPEERRQLEARANEIIRASRV